MSSKVRTLICLALVCCLAAVVAPACAAGGHAYETAVPPELRTEEPAEAPAETEIRTDPSDSNYSGIPEASEQQEEAKEDLDSGAVTASGTEKGNQINENLLDEKIAPHDVLSGEPDSSRGTEEPQETEKPAATEKPTEKAAETPDPRGTNLNDAYALSLPTGEELTEADEYLFALHIRPEAYNPASVLISGVLYAPEETEILEATVTVGNGEPHIIQASDIIRVPCGNDPASVEKLTFEPDRERAGFAFLADLSWEELPDGPTEVTVSLVARQLLTLTTTVELDAGLGKYYHVTRAIREQCLKLDDRDQEDGHITRFQRKLTELGYLTREDETGVFDEKTREAARKALDSEQRNEGNETLSAREVGVVYSLPYTMTDYSENHSDENLPEKVKGFFLGTVTLFEKTIPVWMLSAAGAALLLLILIIILLITGKRRKAKRREKEASTMNELSRRSAFITGQEESEQEAQILSIEDEPTANLADEENRGLVFSSDEPTTDLNTPLYTVRLRLIYAGQYMDTSASLQEGGEAVIGRGENARIQTNPADTSVSHKHGVFSVSGGAVRYTDNSRNGTKYNNQKMLRNGESVSIPFNTRVQIEIGSHTVLIIAAKSNG